MGLALQCVICKINNMFAPYQPIRGARVALDLKQAELAVLASISEKTLRKLELGTPVTRGIMEQVQGALEKLGVTFIAGGAVNGPGMRMPASIVYPPSLNLSDNTSN